MTVKEETWSFCLGPNGTSNPSTQTCPTPPSVCTPTVASTTKTNAVSKTAATSTICKPIADAGQPQTVTEGDKVTLDGSKSSGDKPLGYSWTQMAGPTVTLNGADPASPTFVAEPKIFAPMKDTEKKVTFQLVVTDVHGVPSDPATWTLLLSR